MPGPVVQFPWTAPPLDPLAKEVVQRQTNWEGPGPHPEDDWLGTITQGMLGAVGLGDPNSRANLGGQLATGVLGLGGPLISAYKDATDTPSAMLRAKMGTQGFLDSAQAFSDKHLATPVLEAAQAFAKRYPRVAAHLRLDPNVINEDHYAHILTADVPKWRMPVTFTQRGLDQAINEPGQAINTIFHEGVHGAQNLGNSDFNTLYPAVAKALGKGPANPYEATATTRGDFEMNRANSWFPTRYPDFKDARPTITPTTPEMAKTIEAQQRLKNTVWDTADQRGLLKSILQRQTAEAPEVPYTANRGLQQFIDTARAKAKAAGPYDTDTLQDAATATVIESILKRRGAIK
jgi:hypothetical protein